MVYNHILKPSSVGRISSSNSSNVSAMSFTSELSKMQNVRLSGFPRSVQADRLLTPAQLPKRFVCRAMDATFRSSSDFSTPVFPRVDVRDPFKRLGVSRDASEEEVREARNYLVEQYHAHERSREAIESAYDTIIMESYRSRKATKMNLKSNLKKKVEESPPWVRGILDMVEVPNKTILAQRAALFLLLGVWSVFKPADGGPAFQVAVSLAACVYFINDRVKSVARALVLGVSALVVAWVFGSALVPLLPSQILPRSWSLELSTTLVSYVFLWFSCTFLK